MTENGPCLLIKLPESHPFKCCFWAPGNWGSAYKWLVFKNGESHTWGCRYALFPPHFWCWGWKIKVRSVSNRQTAQQTWIASGVYILVRMFFLASFFIFFLISQYIFPSKFQVCMHASALTFHFPLILFAPSLAFHLFHLRSLTYLCCTLIILFQTLVCISEHYTSTWLLSVESIYNPCLKTSMPLGVRRKTQSRPYTGLQGHLKGD